jgi:hypothetical protein
MPAAKANALLKIQQMRAGSGQQAAGGRQQTSDL